MYTGMQADKGDANAKRPLRGDVPPLTRKRWTLGSLVLSSRFRQRIMTSKTLGKRAPRRANVVTKVRHAGSCKPPKQRENTGVPSDGDRNDGRGSVCQEWLMGRGSVDFSLKLADTSSLSRRQNRK